MEALLIKKLLGKQALEYVKPGMVVGLGSGTTASAFIEELIAVKVQVDVLSSSKASETIAKKGSAIRFLDPNKVTQLDLYVDGTDAFDSNFFLLKGLGAAFFREKILALMAKKVVILADESKKVENFAGKLLPIELLSFGLASTIAHIEKEGFKGKLRGLLSDNGNPLFDITIPQDKTPEQIEFCLRKIPGVLETGFFFHFAPTILFGKKDGSVLTLQH